MTYTNNKDADQPEHQRSLVSACVIRCLDNITPIVAISEIPRLKLASAAEQAGLRLTGSQGRKRYSRSSSQYDLKYVRIEYTVFPSVKTVILRVHILLKQIISVTPYTAFCCFFPFF